MKTITLLFPGAGIDEFTGNTRELVSSILRRLRPEEKGVNYEFFPSDSNVIQAWDKFVRETHMEKTIKKAEEFIKKAIKEHLKKETGALNICLIGQSIGGSYCDRLTNVIDDLISENIKIKPFIDVKSIVIDPAEKHCLRWWSTPDKVNQAVKQLGKCVTESYRFYSTHDYFMRSYVPKCTRHTKMHLISLPVDHTEITGVTFGGGSLFRGSFLQSSGATNIAFAKAVSGQSKKIRDNLERFIILLLNECHANLMQDKQGECIKLTDKSRIKRMNYKKNQNKITRTNNKVLEKNIKRISDQPHKFRVEDVKEDEKLELVDNRACDALHSLISENIASAASIGIKRVWDFSTNPLVENGNPQDTTPALIDLAKRNLTEMLGVDVAEDYLRTLQNPQQLDNPPEQMERFSLNI